MTSAILVLGLIVGMTYGLLAVGLVIVYRVSKVINFAHGAIGAFGAAILGLLVVRYHVPYWVAFVLAIAVSAMSGAVAEVVVVRRLRNAPKVMSLVATLGLAAFFAGLGPALFSQVNATLSFPVPTAFPTFTVGPLLVTTAFSAMLILAPILVVGFAVFLRYSRVGLGLRAASSNPATARTVGIRASRMSMLGWVVASAFAAFTAILVQPTQGFAGSQSFGPELLLRALTAAVVARMSSLPVALLAGVGIGIAEQYIYYEVHTPGAPALFLAALLFAALLFQRRGALRTREPEAWGMVARSRGLVVPAHWRRYLAAVNGIGLIVLLGLAVLAGLLATNSTAVGMAAVAGLAIVALSVGVVTGQGGHLSLGQFAFAGVGAAAALQVAQAVHEYALSFVAAGAAGAAAAVVVGLPALRIRGIMYAVATLGFAYLCSNYLLQRTWLLGSSSVFPQPRVFDYTFRTGRSYYFMALTFLVVALAVLWQLRRNGLSRSFVAMRDNEDAARSFAISARARTLQLFLISGGLAGVGGAVWAYAAVFAPASSFSLDLSVNVVAAAVLGGLTVSAGPLVGALYIFAIPQFVHLDNATTAGTALGWLVLVLYAPSGLTSLAERWRDAALGWLIDRFGPPAADRPDPDDAPMAVLPNRLAERADEAAKGPRHRLQDEAVLQVRGLSKTFGGITAVRGVDLDVRAGEVLGVMGQNGAGKTTLFEMLTGFVKPDGGTVVFDGRSIGRYRPEARARLGLVRSFQDSRLFPTLTVREVLCCAQERTIGNGPLDALFGGHQPERARQLRADDLIELMRLGPFARRRITELSTGTRRIVELACMVALDPRVLLLDEPSSGIAQRESEALASLLLRVRDYLDATLVVIEHDVPLLLSISDRILAMEAGQVLIVDRPEVVIADERVINSYLGTDRTAIERTSAPVLDRVAVAGPRA